MLHNDRAAAHHELHARPFPSMKFDAHLLQLCVKASAMSIEDVWRWLSDQISGLPATPCAWQSDNDYWVKVEPHTEFISILWLSAQPVQLPAHWLDVAPTPIFVLSAFDPAPQDVVETRPVLSQMFEGKLTAGTDFLMGPDGVTRWSYAFSVAPDPENRGRALQMLVEVETYRILAMLRMDQIRAVHPKLQSISVTAAGIQLSGAASQQTLEQLEQCESQLDEVWQQINWRIGACRAYYDLVFQRLEDLTEQTTAGHTSIKRFLGRRMTPAVRTAETVLKRQQELADQVSHKANLLRTRMQLDLHEHHVKQVARQTRLQATVEGLSVVAISYYAYGLLSKFLAPMIPAAATKQLDVALVPAVVVLVWLALKRIKRHL